LLAILLLKNGSHVFSKISNLSGEFYYAKTTNFDTPSYKIYAFSNT